MGRFALTVGDATAVFGSRWPGGAEAGLIPVFEEPTTHPEASVRQGAPTSTEDAVRRITTVAHGHSNLSDPRHGNGGLLGVGLGGTVALPATIDEKGLSELEKAYAASRLELAGAAHPVVVTGGECPRVAAALEADADVIITGYRSWEGAYLNIVGDETLGMAPGPTPVTLPQLDGRRSSLTDQALGKLYIDRLLRERGGFAFSAPLQASRNPLIPAGEQGVLDPERDGHWTIAEDLALTLGDLELRVETEPLYVGGIGETYRHWHDTRHTEIWYTPDGVVLVSHAPVDGLTIVADGALDPNGPIVSGRDIRDARSAPQTWVWGALPDATPSEVAFGDSFQSPDGVEWVFESPVD